MRRFVATVDQLPGWQFVVAALLLLAGVKAWWMGAQLRGNPGAAELGGLLLLAGSVGLSIFAIRRRQTGVWDAAAQLLIALAGANLLSYGFLIPFLPPAASGEVARIVRAGVGETVVGMALVIPVQAGGLWLSRRYGTHSGVTERRTRGVGSHASGAWRRSPRDGSDAGVAAPPAREPVTGGALSPGAAPADAESRAAP